MRTMKNEIKMCILIIFIYFKEKKIKIVISIIRI